MPLQLDSDEYITWLAIAKEEMSTHLIMHGRWRSKTNDSEIGIAGQVEL